MGPERVVFQRSRAARPARCFPAYTARAFLQGSAPFPEAWRKLEQILNITPDDVDTIIEKAVIAQAEGDFPRASAILAPLQPASERSQCIGNTNLPGNPGATARTNHCPAKGNIGEA